MGDEGKVRVLRVIERATGKPVRVVDVSGKSDREVEKVTLGLLRNMDTESFFVEDSADLE